MDKLYDKLPRPAARSAAKPVELPVIEMPAPGTEPAAPAAGGRGAKQDIDITVDDD